MMQRHLWKIPLLLFLIPLLVALAPSVAQDNSCSLLVEQALSNLGQNCDALDRNSACYGFNRLSTTFNEAQSDDFFSKVSDRTPLNIVDTITSAPLDLTNSTWGVAVMKVQANVPNSLPGQAVTFVLLGDTQVRNDVSPSEAFTPADAVEVISIGNVNIRSAPTTRANVIGSVQNATVLLADGRSADGEWLRVLFDEAPAWVNINLVNTPDAADGLPVVTEELRTPMQAFYVTTGVGSTKCNEAPDVLMIQGPDSMKVDLTINGADVQIGSTVVIRSLPASFDDIRNNPELVKLFGALLEGQDLPGDFQCNVSQLIVIDGQADINGETLTLPTGFSAQSIDCGGSDRTSSFRTPWGGSRPLTQEELDELKTLEDLPPELLNYPVRLPTQEEIQEILRTFGGGGGGSGPSNVGAAGNSTMCRSFQPTSPLGTMPGQTVQFYWDAAPGATSYTVRVYDSSGAQVGEYSVDAPTTTVSGNPSGTGNLSWDVSAYINGQLACTSGRVGTLRDTVYTTASTAALQFTSTCLNTMITPCDAPCTLGAACGTIPGKEFLCVCPA